MKSCKHSLSSKRRVSSLLLSTALLILGTCSCAVPIKEENFYTDAGEQGAVITHFFSTDSSAISKAAWDSIREGMVCMSPDAVGDIKGEFEKLCSKVTCTQVTSTIVAIEPKSPSPEDMRAFRKSVLQLSEFLARLQAARGNE